MGSADRVDRLIARLPAAVCRASRWLRRPSSRWARVPAGVLLVTGGVLSILPVLGLWMLPLGVILLAEDIAALQRARERMLDMIERHRPHWFTSPAANADDPDAPVGDPRDRTEAADAKEWRDWSG